jgi:hypothetical protein
MRKIQERTVKAATSTSVKTSATTALTAGEYGDFVLIHVFFDDGAAAARAYTVYTYYSPDSGTTSFEDYNNQISASAKEDVVADIVGGFYSTVTAVKAVAAEDVTISAFGDWNPGFHKKVDLQAATTVSCKTSATALWTCPVGVRDCDYVIFYIDDNGNANNLTLQPQLSDDQGTSWFNHGGTINGHSAANRRCAVIVANNGLYCRVAGTKGVGAENVIVTVEGRMRLRKLNEKT